MKTLNQILISLFFIFTFYSSLSAQDSTQNAQNPQKVIQHGAGFVDLNGDGYNDNAPDHDGDGIPNGLDKDYIRFKRNGQGQGKRVRFIDLDGDGINDNTQGRSRKGKNRQMQLNSTLPLNNNANNTGQTSGSTTGKQTQKRGNK